MTKSTRRHARLLLVASVGLIAGCATGAPVNGGMSAGPSIEGGGARGDPLSGVAEFKVAQRATVAVPIAEAWTRLAKAYSDLGVPLTTVTPTAHILGNEGMKRSHTLGNERLSSMLDCGTGGGGANADIYSVNMSVVSRLQARTDSTTEVATMVQATAAPMSFGNPPVVCSTTGWLEGMISAAVGRGASSK
ncbi:MAG: hypothetical protein ABI229_07995 [Gemmatimonadaceae bacterium]